MKDSLKIALGIVIGILALIGLAAVCLFCFAGFLLFNVPSRPTLAPVGIVPPVAPLTPGSTPAPNELGQSVVYQDVKTTVIEYQFSGPYKGEYGSDVKPPEKAKFFWLRIAAENTGELSVDLPRAGNFVLIYKGTEIRSNYLAGLYNERPGYTQYSGGRAYPGVRKEGWILFELPADARPEEIQVRFNASDTLRPVYFSWQLGH
jgi:hypothetical protein